MVAHEKRRALRRVARRVQRADDHVSERDLRVVVQRREGELQFGTAMIVDRRAGACGELAFSSDFDILNDLELRIDDRGAALAASTENVRGATGLGSQELAKNHDGTPWDESV